MYLTANEFLARMGGVDALCAEWELDAQSSLADIQDAVDAALNVEGINLRNGDRMTAESIGDVEAIVRDYLRPPAPLLPRHRVTPGTIGALEQLSRALREVAP